MALWFRFGSKLLGLNANGAGPETPIFLENFTLSPAELGGVFLRNASCFGRFASRFPAVGGSYVELLPILRFLSAPRRNNLQKLPGVALSFGYPLPPNSLQKFAKFLRFFAERLNILSEILLKSAEFPRSLRLVCVLDFAIAAKFNLKIESLRV